MKGYDYLKKNYGFSCLAKRKIESCWNEEKMIAQDQIWEEGKVRYGFEYMWRTYGIYYLEILEFHKCYLYAGFDYERLGLTTKEGWKIPDKIIGIKMYKDIRKMINFFEGVTDSPKDERGSNLWVQEFGYSGLVEYYFSATEEEKANYIKKLNTFRKEREGKFLFLVDKK